jgi:2-polyprenyl-6-methoxyphenol hydroxylase-like FAD-dependent oxidoreductase
VFHRVNLVCGWSDAADAGTAGTPEELSGNTRLFLGDASFFGFVPVGERRTYGFADVYQPRFRDPVEGRLERLRQRFATFGPPVQEYLASLERDEQVHCAAMEWVDVEEWYTGRVVLVGDAAHASSPLMGQGGVWRWRMRPCWPKSCAPRPP